MALRVNSTSVRNAESGPDKSVGSVSDADFALLPNAAIPRRAASRSLIGWLGSVAHCAQRNANGIAESSISLMIRCAELAVFFSSSSGIRNGTAFGPSFARAKSVWLSLPLGRSSTSARIASEVPISPSGLASQPPGSLRRAERSSGTSEGVQEPQPHKIAPARFRQPRLLPAARRPAN